MSAPILTLADVKAKGLAAFTAGQLTAQGPNPVCKYRTVDNRVCIVGAAIPEGSFDTGNYNLMRITELAVEKVVEINPEELPAIQRLQTIHDRWCHLQQGGSLGDPNRECPVQELIGMNADQVKAVLERELTS